MLARRYEMPWRRAYESYAGIGWLAAMAFFVVAGATLRLPRSLALPLAVLCFCMGVLRLVQAVRTLVLRASLSGRGIQVITTTELARWCRKPDEVFLGFGFEWRPVHSQRLYELAKIDYREFTVSPRLLTLLGYQSKPQPDAEIGLAYIHGVEPKEVALHRPLQNFEGGTLLVGTTQSGKGVALASLITQAVRRGDVVIVIDPKNSRRLKRVTQRACEDWRETDTFLEFHPAFPEAGVRLDFTFNWQKPTEIASRIQSIMPPDTAGAFSAFGWDAVNVVVQGLVELEERPNLVKLTKYIEGGIEPVLEGTLRRYYERALGAGWRELPEMKKLLNDAHRGNIKRPSKAASADLLQYRHWQQEFAGDVVLIQLGAFVEQLQWPPRRILKARVARAPTPRGGLRRMRPTRRGAVQGFPLTQLDRRVAGLVAAGRSVTFVAQRGESGGGLMRRVPVARWVPGGANEAIRERLV